MGLMDEAQQWVEKGEQLAKEHPEQAKEAVEKVEGVIEEQTGHRFDSQIQSAGNQAENYLNQQN